MADAVRLGIDWGKARIGVSAANAGTSFAYPVETVMAGLPHLEQTRSLSRYGLSQVTVVFKDGTDIYFARQLVNERIQEARDKLPAGITPAMGPISTGLGEIYLWTVETEDGAKKPDGTPYTATDLREIQDWIIKPQLRNVPGVTEINSIGGYAKEYQIAPIPARLASLGVTLQDIVTALDRNNGNVGAGYIEKRGEQYLIRAPGQVKTLEDIGNVILSSAGGVPIRVRDVGVAVDGPENAKIAAWAFPGKAEPEGSHIEPGQVLQGQILQRRIVGPSGSRPHQSGNDKTGTVVRHRFVSRGIKKQPPARAVDPHLFTKAC